ncbi:hypothetical protein EON73_00370 [bacterium]|nr:MAG: hypothetical protein EON73_00370 [bacterium]
MAPTAEMILDFNMAYGQLTGYSFNCQVFNDDSSFHLLFNGQYVGTIDSNKNGVLEQTNGVPIPETTLTLIKERIINFYG